MEIIRLTTWMDAPMERCFRLAAGMGRSAAAATPHGSAADAVAPGVAEEGALFRWQGKRFGRLLTHTCKIDEWRPYSHFRDVMVEGSFVRFEHEHHFAVMDDGTRMRDEIRFALPYGLLGRAAEKMVLRRHLLDLLKQRNALIKRVAESEEWRRYLERTGSVAPVSAMQDKLMREWDKRGALQRS